MSLEVIPTPGVSIDDIVVDWLKQPHNQDKVDTMEVPEDVFFFLHTQSVITIGDHKSFYIFNNRVFKLI